MALAGALRENTRRNESLDRGTAAVTGSLVVTVTGTPGPIRVLTHAMACINDPTLTVAESAFVTVGTFTANTFTIYVWDITGAASIVATNVEWLAWGNLA